MRGQGKRWRKYEVTDYQKNALQFLKPPEDLNVSEWAGKYRILDAKTSAAPGPWKNSKTPYLQEIMDTLSNYEIEETVFCKPTQIGGSESLLNMAGYIIDQDAAPTMVVYPTDTLAKWTSENRIKPMLELSPALRKKWDENGSSQLELQFRDMYLVLAGSNSPSSLASRPIKYLFLDEVDKYPGASNREADPISLARERTKTFPNRKIFQTSTPTLKSGHIWSALESCDVVKHYFVPCPHCGEEIEFIMQHLKFPGEEDMSYADRAELAVYKCQKCGGIIEDRHKPGMLRGGRWKIVETNTKYARKIGYWINTLYSPFVRWAEIAKEFLTSKDDPEKLQNFVNSWLAEPWEDTKIRTSADLVLDRQTDLPELWLPPWTKLLTAGVDVQETSLYWSIRAWGDYLTSQNIAHGQARSLQEIEDIMCKEYSFPSGDTRLVDLCLIDSGDQTDVIYEFCVGREDWVLPVKGSSKDGMLSNYKISKINRVDSRAYGMQLVIIDTGKYKDSIAARMHRENGRGSWMVYSGCDREYAEQVTAEHKIKVRRNGRTVERWVTKKTHSDNHYLDTEVYTYAAADMCGARALHLTSIEEQKPQKQQTLPEQISPEEDWISKNELEDWRV